MLKEQLKVSLSDYHIVNFVIKTKGNVFIIVKRVKGAE